MEYLVKNKSIKLIKKEIGENNNDKYNYRPHHET